MRVKDENKKDAITKAIITLINEMGFANVSMSKIAKATGISAATLYVYYENKEDMFRKVYMDVKMQMIRQCSGNISADEPMEMTVRKLCGNLLRYMQEHTDEFLFVEQAYNSPLVTEEMLAELQQHNEKIHQVFQDGVQRGILKQASPSLLLSFCFYPIQQFFKECHKERSMLPDVDFDLIFQMCWDAIKK